VLYQGENSANLPVNERLTVLATRFGIVDRAFHATARGDALVLGMACEAVDIDVPDAVTVAAHRCGYRVTAGIPSSASACAGAPAATGDCGVAERHHLRRNRDHLSDLPG
jgi:hypothetical protein